jgi:hypothetical protein
MAHLTVFKFQEFKKQWSDFLKQARETYSATAMKTIAVAVDDPEHETDVMALSCRMEHVRAQDLVQSRLMRTIVNAFFAVEEDAHPYDTVLSIPVDVYINRQIDITKTKVL